MRSLVCTALLLLAPSLSAAQVRIARPSGSGATLMATAPGGPPPSGIRAGSTPTTITIKWVCPAGATGYEVFATQVGSQQQLKLTATPIAPQCVQDFQTPSNLNLDPRIGLSTQTTYSSGYTHTGLTVGMQFAYVIRALYPQGVGDAEPFIAQTAPFPAPAGVTPTLSGRSVRLSWNSVQGATAYNVLRQLAGESALTQLTPAPITATSYSDATILAPGDHRYSVQAVDGTPAAAVVVHVGNWPAPSFTQSVLTGRRITLNWTAIAGAPSYAVFRKSGSETAFRQVATRPASEAWYVEHNLPLGPNTYYVQVTGAADPTAPVTVISGKPQAGVRIYRGRPTLDFGWLGADLATGIRLLRSPFIQGQFADVTSKTDYIHRETTSAFGATRYRHATVGPTEYYKIVADYPTGSMESDVIPATIPPGPVGPTNLVPQSPAQTDQFVSRGFASVWITWTCDPEATSYKAMLGPHQGGLERIKDSRGFPLTINGCALLHIWDPGNIPVWDFKIVGDYPDIDTSSEAIVPVVAVKKQ